MSSSQYLVRYHDDDNDISNYEFIFQITDSKITKVIYMSIACYMCNSDSIYAVTHSGVQSLESNGLKIIDTKLNEDNEPDVLVLDGHPDLLLFRVYKGSRMRYVDKLNGVLKGV